MNKLTKLQVVYEKAGFPLILQQLMNFPESFYKYYQTPEGLFYLYSTHYIQQPPPTQILTHLGQNLGTKDIRLKTQMIDASFSINQQGGCKTGTDGAAQPDAVITPVKIQTKMQQYFPIKDSENQLNPKASNSQVSPSDNTTKQKYLKKNTQSNLMSNVFSYICTHPKSHRVVQQLIGNNPQKIKIFYIFANNFKRINGKYVNRKNIKAICEIVPKQSHFKMLSKSIKRLIILPMSELRVIFRKLIFNYFRGPQSIVALMTSRKLCKIGLQEHFNRRRELCKYVTTMLKDYN